MTLENTPGVDPLPRLVALAVGGLMVGLTILMHRRGIFGKLQVIVLPAEPNANICQAYRSKLTLMP